MVAGRGLLATRIEVEPHGPPAAAGARHPRCPRGTDATLEMFGRALADARIAVEPMLSDPEGEIRADRDRGRRRSTGRGPVVVGKEALAFQQPVYVDRWPVAVLVHGECQALRGAGGDEPDAGEVAGLGVGQRAEVAVEGRPGRRVFGGQQLAGQGDDNAEAVVLVALGPVAERAVEQVGDAELAEPRDQRAGALGGEVVVVVDQRGDGDDALLAAALVVSVPDERHRASAALVGAGLVRGQRAEDEVLVGSGQVVELIREADEGEGTVGEAEGHHLGVTPADLAFSRRFHSATTERKPERLWTISLPSSRSKRRDVRGW